MLTEFENVVHLVVIFQTRLNLVRTGWLVPVIVSVLEISAVLHPFLKRQLKKSFPKSKLLINFFLRKATNNPLA